MYEIGQIIYIVSDKLHRIIPVKIVEHITRKSMLKDTTVEYFFTTNDLNDLRNDITKLNPDDTLCFVTLEDARSYLLNEAENAIDKIVTDARGSKEINFPNSRGVSDAAQ